MLYQQRVSQGVDSIARALMPRLPVALNWIGRAVPDRLQHLALARSLNYLLREAIVLGELDFFTDKVLNICIKDLGVNCSIRYRNKSVLVAEALSNPHLRFSADSYDLLLIATQKLDPDMLFFQRRLEMNGDTELGLGIKNMLASIELHSQLHPRVAATVQQIAGLILRYR